MSQRPHPLPSPLAFIAATLLYMLVASMAPPADLQAPGGAFLLRPTSGLALALLILGGIRHAASVLTGALLAQAVIAAPPVAAISEALAATATAVLGAWLLQREDSFDGRCHSFAACRQLFVYAGGAGAGVGALAWVCALVLSGQIDADTWAPQLLRRWMSDALGILLVTPLLLSWQEQLGSHKKLRRIPEGLLLCTLAFIAGQVIFSGWLHNMLRPFAYAYWTFLFVVWASIRLNMMATVGLLCIFALQAWWGTHQGTGFFATDIAASHGFGYWSYMMILSMVGMSLAAHLTERRRQKADLRIAAIAFECQEGLLITNAQGVILRANQSLLKMSGYAAHELLGKTPQFLRVHDPNTPHMDGGKCLPRQDLQRRDWHQRKSGETYPVWVTITPVADSHARTTHYVLTMIDITDRQQQERERIQREQVHREALVREVHHRIKNNLQGIIGMLRGLGRQHAELDAPITEVIGQVQSIAVIHGLQGRDRTDHVRLCELTSAVAAGIESLWNTPITVDIPAVWQPCRIDPTEAVPVALVLNELILNAVKHGGKAHQDVRVALRQGAHADIVQITISNPGQWPQETESGHVGLDLVATLMPRSGARLFRKQAQEMAITQLEFHPPVIHTEQSDAHDAP